MTQGTVEARVNKVLADNQGLGSTWTACFSASRSIRFVTLDSGTAVLDDSTPVDFNFPTVVSLTQLVGHSSAAPVGLGLTVLGLALAAILWRLRR